MADDNWGAYLNSDTAHNIRRRKLTRKNVLARRNRLVGKRFGMLVVLRRYSTKYSDCRCDCGNEKAVANWNLQSGRQTSCGCQHFSEAHRAKLSAAASARYARMSEDERQDFTKKARALRHKGDRT